MQAYSLVYNKKFINKKANILNDVSKKPNKNILLLGIYFVK